MSTVPVARMSSLSSLYSTAPVFTPIRCNRSGESCTGARGVSILCSGMGSAIFIPVDGAAATGCASPDLVGGCCHWRDRYAQTPATTAKAVSQTREVLKTYLFIAVSLLSGIRDGPKRFRDPPASARIRASGRAGWRTKREHGRTVLD